MHVALLALALALRFAAQWRFAASFIAIVRRGSEIALDLGRSQKLLDPFRFVELLVERGSGGRVRISG